ncbi:unnamed protein product [Closterium sp. Yama58-4]|nr:unnamed protein product [Closterium sp. Yama58-4]
MAMVLALSPSSLLVRSDVRTASLSGSKAGEIQGARLHLIIDSENLRFGLAGETSGFPMWSSNSRRIVTTAAVKGTNKRRAKVTCPSGMLSRRGRTQITETLYGWSPIGSPVVKWCHAATATRMRSLGGSRYYDSSEGALLVTPVPWDLLDSWQQENGRGPLDRSRTVVGMLFLPREAVDAAKQLVEDVIEARGNGMQVIGWREVPVYKYAVGWYGEASMPSIQQLVLSTPNPVEEDFPTGFSNLKDLIHLTANGEWVEVSKTEREIVSVRMEKPDPVISLDPFRKIHVCSLSDKCLVYKAVCKNDELGKFFLDLSNELVRSRFVFYERCINRSLYTNLTWGFPTGWN